MILNLSAIAVRERAVTLFFILLLVSAGAYAFVMLGRTEHPNITINTLTVTTVWPGATAREMHDLVAEPLEKRLQELTWYDRVCRKQSSMAFSDMQQDGAGLEQEEIVLFIGGYLSERVERPMRGAFHVPIGEQADVVALRFCRKP